MPRLFTSTRPPPVNITTMHPLLATALPVAVAPSGAAPCLQAKRKLPELADDEPDLELIDEHASYNPHELHAVAGSTAQHNVQSLQQNELNLAGVVKVPPVNKILARLMDSHDLDNPYLVAAFNVLVANDNNPMRVPDILQAVQKHGWTQVLHRHKDRPEQLFGNALRAHQRRREFMNKPSLVFMVDAGGCWKHHELDLSAASGRRKGKIWCLSIESGYACPYARLGLDLNWVIKAQYGPGGPQPAKPDNGDEPSAKRRKVDAPEPARLIPAAKLVPSRPQQPKSASESATLKSPQILLQPPKVYHPSSVITQTVPRVAVTHATAVAVPPSTASSSKSASSNIRAAARSAAEVTPVVSLLSSSRLTNRKASLKAKDARPTSPAPVVDAVVEYHPMDEDPLPGYHSGSDEDDDDFHVTMQDFTATAGFDLSPIRSSHHDQDLDCSGSSDESIARTPTPPPAPTTLLTLNCNYDSQEMLLLGVQPVAQDVMMDDPAWSWLTQAGEKNLDLLAAARVSDTGRFEDEFPPFEEFLDRRKMAITMAAVATTNDVPVVKVEDLEIDISSHYTSLEFDAASLFEGHNPGSSSRSSSSWIGRITRESSVCSTTGSICSAATSLSVPSLSVSSSFSSQPMTTLQSSTTTTVPLFIATHSLTDDSLIVAEARSLPLKNGLAHQYVTVATPSTDEVSEFFGSSLADGGAVNEEIKELEEELVDWDAMAADDSEPLSVESPQSTTQPMEVMSSPPVTLTVSTVGL